MAVKYTSGSFRKIVLLLLLIIFIFLGGILLVDFVGTMFGVYFPVPGLDVIKSLSSRKKIKTSENPYLLEREELSKEKEKLSMIEEQLLVRQKEIESMELEVKKKIETVKEKEGKLTEREKMLDDKENKFKNKKENIREQAVKLYNMPPKDSVKLLNLQDEPDIIDILREIDVYSAEIGRSSISPFLLKLLGDENKEKAGNVLRKLKYSPEQKRLSGVDILEDEKTEIPPQP